MSESNQLIVAEAKKEIVSTGIFNPSPEAAIEHAARIANALRPVIEQHGMYSTIQGKKYIKVEGWQTLGTLLGILPKEVSVVELPDGSYDAKIDLINYNTGTVVGGASALCGIDEPRWSNAQRYARRSMAVTRATGKAYRLSFGWVITLAGYEATPAEEMVDVIPAKPSPTTTAAPKPTGFSLDNKAHVEWFEQQLDARQVPPGMWDDVAKKLIGRPSSDFAKVLSELWDEADGR